MMSEYENYGVRACPMTFQEPTPESLKAMAGWAISKKRDASDEQALALGKFQYGCSELAECCPAPRAIVTSGHVRKTPVATSTYVPPSVDRMEIVPDAIVLTRFGMVQPCNGTSHTFDIRTQRCKSCGKTYREVMGRQPELM